jgi:hypothetical protein
MRVRKTSLWLALLLAAAPWLAPGAQAAWGPRVGVSDGPDQVLAGFHWHAGTLAPRLHVQPSAVVGIGADLKVFTMAVPLHYRFPVRSKVTPFVGGGAAAGVIDPDGDRSGDTNFEIGLEVLGGLDWRLAGGSRFALELNFGFGDLHDIQLFAGWMLR